MAVLETRDLLGEAVEALGSGLTAQSGRSPAADSVEALKGFFLDLLRLNLRVVLREVASARGLAVCPAPVRAWSDLFDVAQLSERAADFWLPPELAHFAEYRVDDEALESCLAGLRSLAGTCVDSPVFGDLDGVFEGVLERKPRLSGDRLILEEARGSERKTSGSYYTPSSLVERLLSTTLDVVLAEVETPEQLLALRVLDPSCGSGRFLLAASARLGQRLSDLRGRSAGAEGDRAEATQSCIYGVDLSPLALDLCQAQLWLAAGGHPSVGPGTLGQQIRRGDALLGVDAQLLASGIPDLGLRARRGEDRRALSTVRSANRQQRQDGPLPGPRDDESAARAADLLCAALVGERSADAPVPTHARLAEVLEGALTRPEEDRFVQTSLEGRFPLHWSVEFPDSFDVVLGNPPWERVALSEVEFFATRNESISAARTKSERAGAIDRLAESDPALHASFLRARSRAEASSHFLRTSGRFPLCGHGDVNTYSVFAELMVRLLRPGGRLGCVVPTGLLTEMPTRRLVQDLVRSSRLVEVIDFQNQAGLFPDVSRVVRFSLLTVSGESIPEPARLFFLARELGDLSEEGRWVALEASEIAHLNPLTGTLATLTCRRSASLLSRLHRELPLLGCSDTAPQAAGRGVAHGPWSLRFGTLFHMAGDSHLFESSARLLEEGWVAEGGALVREEERRLPLLEAKLLHHFNHRYADYGTSPGTSPTRSSEARLSDPEYRPAPRYWVAEEDVEDRLPADWAAEWVIGWRNICRSTDERTVIATVVPRVGLGHSINLLYPDQRWRSRAALLQANLSSLVFDWCARQKLSGVNLTQGVFRQLPVLPPERYDAPAAWQASGSLEDWLLPRALELTYTSWDLAPFAREAGADRAPFGWTDTRRRRLRAEIDAAFLHLYGLGREEVELVLDGFPRLHRREQKELGEQRTRSEVLAAWELLQGNATSVAVG